MDQSQSAPANSSQYSLELTASGNLPTESGALA